MEKESNNKQFIKNANRFLFGWIIIGVIIGIVIGLTVGNLVLSVGIAIILGAAIGISQKYWVKENQIAD